MPWVGFVVVPLVLLGSQLLAISEGLGAWVLLGASYSIDVFWRVLNCLCNVPYVKWSHSTPELSITARPAWSCVAAFTQMPTIRASKSGLTSPRLFAQQIPRTDGSIKLSILNVSRGLAAVVETEHRVLLHDTGPKPKYSESLKCW